MEVCEHLEGVDRNVKPKTPEGCQECLEMGDEWVHLRLCLECGHVGCCDNSKNKHATAHYHATDHPVITSYEKGETWKYCYVDDVAAE